MSGETRDALFRGAVNFWQPAKGLGYRFNMDSVFLANFVRPSVHCVDLGAGCGVIINFDVNSTLGERPAFYGQSELLFSGNYAF